MSAEGRSRPDARDVIRLCARLSRTARWVLPLLPLIAGCVPPAARTAGGTGSSAPSSLRPSLAEARRGFVTRLLRRDAGGDPPPAPPPGLFKLVRYPSASGRLAAYVTPDPRDGRKRPAIVWLTGGDCSSIGEVWEPAPPSNDQTARAFREAGIVMMFPSLRGGNNNPGVKEGFLGEVQDVLAAADFLARQPHVDPDRIYLGGHSTGGSLVLLVAECSARFRAVFAFGPVGTVAGYGEEYLPFDRSRAAELELRDPIRWLHAIRSPVFVIEGTEQPGNLDALRELSAASRNPNVQFLAVAGADHFSVLAPTTRTVADAVRRDTGPACTIAFTEDQLGAPFRR